MFSVTWQNCQEIVRSPSLLIRCILRRIVLLVLKMKYSVIHEKNNWWNCISICIKAMMQLFLGKKKKQVMWLSRGSWRSKNIATEWYDFCIVDFLYFALRNSYNYFKILTKSLYQFYLSWFILKKWLYATSSFICLENKQINFYSSRNKYWFDFTCIAMSKKRLFSIHLDVNSY